MKAILEDAAKGVVLIVSLLLIYGVWKVGVAIGWMPSVTLLVVLLGGNTIWNIVFKKPERIETNPDILYTPNKVVGIVTSLWCTIVGGGLFYYVMNFTTLETVDFVSVMTIVFLLAVLPLVATIYQTIRDRNDFLRLSPASIHYRDDKNTVTLETAQMYSVKKVSGGISILFIEKPRHLIPVDDMGFSTELGKKAAEDVDRLIPDANRSYVHPSNRPKPQQTGSRDTSASTTVGRADESAPEPGQAVRPPVTVGNMVTIILALGMLFGGIYLIMRIERSITTPLEQYMVTGNESVDQELATFMTFKDNVATWGLVFLFSVLVIGCVVHFISERRKNRIIGR